MRKFKATVLALGALVMMAPAAHAGGHSKAVHAKKGCIVEAIKAKFAHVDAKIDRMHKWKMSKHAHKTKVVVAKAAPAKAKAAPKKAAPKPMK
ncbi:MAG TPA: hypothetical protein PK970_06200 [Hyphomicrobiaceae bacterium]|nr:hypothetical protein [Hyphomicrobiaceae bacterium]